MDDKFTTKKYFTKIDWAYYDEDNLCNGIDLRRHVAAVPEEVAGFSPDFSFITVAVPDCLPDRLEVTSSALEFELIHGGRSRANVIDKNIADASLDEMEEALEQGGKTGEILTKSASGKR
ncbi:MAG: hypothetical protein Q9195_002539 [Heterodermia aff. obscurata]